jgi:hypothetical protein
MKIKRFVIGTSHGVGLALALQCVLLAPEASAIQNYRGNVIGVCENSNGFSTNIRAEVTAGGNWIEPGMTYTFVPANGGAPIIRTGTMGADPNNQTIAHFSVAPGGYTVYVGNPTPEGTPVSANGPDLQATYHIVAPSCQQATGSLNVHKNILVDPRFPPPNIPFVVDVHCTPNGPNTSVTLTSSNQYTQIVNGIRPGSRCTVVERPLPACHWVTSYPSGQTAVVSAGQTANSIVLNKWVCQ